MRRRSLLTVTLTGTDEPMAAETVAESCVCMMYASCTAISLETARRSVQEVFDVVVIDMSSSW